MPRSKRISRPSLPCRDMTALGTRFPGAEARSRLARGGDDAEATTHRTGSK